MIPLLSLGIPGDPATAVILGGMMIHGLQPGPMLFKTDLPVIYAIYIAIVLAYVVTLVVQIWGIRVFVRVLRVPPHSARGMHRRDVRAGLIRDPQLDPSTST